VPLFQHLDDATQARNIAPIAVDGQDVADRQEPAPERRLEKRLAAQVINLARHRPADRRRVHVTDMIGDDQAAALRHVLAPFNLNAMQGQFDSNDIVSETVKAAHLGKIRHGLIAI